MREPDMHYESQLTVDVDTATNNLSENLHLKWQYGLLFIDKYTDEHQTPVSVVSGLRRDDDTSYYMRIHIIDDKAGSLCKIDLWKVMTSGWPFPTGVGSPKTDTLIDLIDDLLSFCRIPYENTGGVMPIIRNMFSTGGEKRTQRD